jgi:hypothetical protein
LQFGITATSFLYLLHGRRRRTIRHGAEHEIRSGRSTKPLQYSHIITTRRVFETGAINRKQQKEISRPDAWIELNPGALNEEIGFSQDVAARSI